MSITHMYTDVLAGHTHTWIYTGINQTHPDIAHDSCSSHTHTCIHMHRHRHAHTSCWGLNAHLCKSYLFIICIIRFDKWIFIWESIFVDIILFCVRMTLKMFSEPKQYISLNPPLWFLCIVLTCHVYYLSIDFHHHFQRQQYLCQTSLCQKHLVWKPPDLVSDIEKQRLHLCACFCMCLCPLMWNNRTMNCIHVS